jgi:hypothetical protein
MLCVALWQVVAVEDDGLKFKLQLILHLGFTDTLRPLTLSTEKKKNKFQFIHKTEDMPALFSTIDNSIPNHLHDQQKSKKSLALDVIRSCSRSRRVVLFSFSAR